jgi:hypothetical protein
VHDLGRKLFEKPMITQVLLIKHSVAGHTSRFVLSIYDGDAKQVKKRLIKHNRILINKKETQLCFPFLFSIKLVIVTKSAYQMIL